MVNIFEIIGRLMFYENHIKCEIIKSGIVKFRAEYDSKKIYYILYFAQKEYEIVKNNTDAISTKDFHTAMKSYGLTERIKQ